MERGSSTIAISLREFQGAVIRADRENMKKKNIQTIHLKKINMRKIYKSCIEIIKLLLHSESFRIFFCFVESYKFSGGVDTPLLLLLFITFHDMQGV